MNTTFTRLDTYTLKWAYFPYLKYGPIVRQVRSGFEYKMDACFKCRKPFQDGDSMGIGCTEELGNKCFCEECSRELNFSIITPDKVASVAEPKSSDHQTS